MDKRTRDHLTNALGRKIVGYLDEPTCTDVYLNPPLVRDAPSELWVECLGNPPERVGTMGEIEARRLVQAVAGTLDEIIDEKKPWIEGELYGDGPRVSCMVPPASMAPAFAIRVPAVKRLTLQDYVEQDVMTEWQRKCLEDAISRRLNIIVCASTGTGKTTLLNALGEAVHRLTPDDRMVVIEGARELRIPVRNQIGIRTGEHLSEESALVRAMRWKPTRIWVGEVRGAEVNTMLMAWNTGHEGGACSIHSGVAKPDRAMRRLAQMVELSGVPAQHEVIASVVNVVACLAIVGGQRRMTGLYLVKGWSADHGYRFQEEF